MRRVDKGLEKQSGGKGSLSRHSLCRLLRRSKSKSQSPIHKRRQGQKGELLAISQVSRDRRRDAKRPPPPFSRAGAREAERKRRFCGRHVRWGGRGISGNRIFAAHYRILKG